MVKPCKKIDKKWNNAMGITLFALAWPTMLESLLQTVLQYVDTAMVGHLGAKATATVSLSATYGWLINSVMGAFGMAFLSYIARAIGEANQEKIKKAAAQTVLVVFALGTLLLLISLFLAPRIPRWMGAEQAIWQDATTYFTYISIPLVFRAASAIFGASLRAAKDTKTPMIINVAVNVMNIGLNYTFIYALGYGAVGAGIATGISYTIGGICMSIAFFRNKTWDIRRRDVLPDKTVLQAIASLGIPMMLTRFASCSGHVVFTSFVSSMATSVYAAHAIAITAEEIFYMPGYGMQAATATLVGNAMGEGNKKKERDVKIVALWMIFLIMCITGVLLYVNAAFMMEIFTTDKQVIAIGTKLLKMVAFTEPIYGVTTVLEGIYSGMGRTKYPLVVELISMWGVRIFGTFICVVLLGLDIYAVWVMMILNNVLKAVLLAAGLKGRKAVQQ